MPVYEYTCGKCERRFEVLIRRSIRKVACPDCRSTRVHKVFSLFGLNLGATPEGPPFKQ